jgi:glycosyltransferase involved in cell wall biosynthesis
MSLDSKPLNPKVKISVVICAHNSRRDYLNATLDSLKRQSLPFSDWELIFVDNNSSPRLEAEIALDWHPNARHVFEPEPGLARARVCGYRNSTGHLLINSDDDNILDQDYLEQAWKVAESNPRIGTFGCQLFPEFEVSPANEFEKSLGGAREFDRERWSNIPDDNRTMPFGAGMVIRSAIATEYLSQVDADPRRLGMGRTEKRLLTGEDIDVNWVATGMGFGTGLFPELKLKHFIPKNKMSAEHLIRYAGGNAYSMVILHWLHFGEVRIPRYSQIGALAYWLRIWLRMDSFARRMELAQIKGRREAVEDMKKWGWLSASAQ